MWLPLPEPPFTLLSGSGVAVSGRGSRSSTWARAASCGGCRTPTATMWPRCPQSTKESPVFLRKKAVGALAPDFERALHDPQVRSAVVKPWASAP